jgi:hypothetical protein
MRNPSRVVMQFYPSSDDQIQLITSIAQRAGFGGGVVVDYPNSKKAKKLFLCLFVGGGGGQHQIPKGLQGDEEDESKARFERRRQRERMRLKEKRKSVRDRDWILKKKEVRVQYMFLLTITYLITCSCIVNEAKKVYRMTQSTLGERGESSFEDRNITVSHHGGRSASRPSANEILAACCNCIFGRIPDE